ncbi:MAG: porin [Rhodobacteraceae bacterium]|nr:porin [Paracoccaceae bacterium]
MKNVLFATTALVAFAGAAVAEVGFSGDVEVGYYDDGTAALTNGFYAEGSLDLTASMDFDYGVSVEVTYGADLYTGLTWDAFPTVVITTEWVTLTAGNAESAGLDHYSDVDGMGGTAGFNDADANGDFLVRADVTFGDISASVSGVAAVNPGALTLLSVGASGSFGSVSFGVGYDDGGEMGISVGTSFGGFDVDVAYQADAVENSVGVAVGTTIGSMDVAGYYAMNSAAATDDAYGVSVNTTFGDASVGVYWDGDAGGASNFGVDVEYAVSEAITVFAGYDQADLYYVGAIMDIADGAAVGASYADDTNTATEFGPQDFAAGLKVWFSAEF